MRIRPAPGLPDLEGRRVAAEAAQLGLGGPWKIDAGRGFLIAGDLSEADLRRAAESVLSDPVSEAFTIHPADAASGDDRPTGPAGVVHVLPLPGVTDPEAESAAAILADLGFAVTGCRTVRRYEVDGPGDSIDRLVDRVLSNSAVEQAIFGPIAMDRLTDARPYALRLVEVPVRAADEGTLRAISRDGQLSLDLAEMIEIRDHFLILGRDPTDCELETIAQTWSEHCSHKTLKGRIEFEGEIIDNLLRETIFGATRELGLDWLVSVFSDNAGVVRFDEGHDVCFKVETHNHPSAIDPYGGANTGLGGVIRDVLGTGLGARPIANTDVFCVAPPDTDPASLPPGVLHPRRVLEGVVAGVRDYGNRMGIPTVNGALVVDPRYLANPLVFCGSVGVLPVGMATKSVEPGDRIVAIGGRTGRDGIHGATFSSAELTSESEGVSGGAVQIGDAITEKMVLDVVVRARDRRLFRSITDCGAGGFSSAVGEMAEGLGAEVDLDRAPLKYVGLSYTEIWISEAQERMVLAVPPESWPELLALCESEGVEATDLGAFTDSGRLTLRYEGVVVADLSLDFLHEGRPKVVRPARRPRPIDPPPPSSDAVDCGRAILDRLRSWDVASKEWIVRQYDHEVQGRTVVKPLVGAEEDGPGDAAVILPVRGSTAGLAIACGMAVGVGEADPEAMAIAAVDEAIRNCVAVGADPDRIALLDNFCWGDPTRPETLGSLVLAARGCRVASLANRAPFISGKDSLYNEYEHDGRRLAIPPTLLISAIGRVADARLCVTMDLKAAGNLVVLVGRTDPGPGFWGWLRAGESTRDQSAAWGRNARAVHRAISGGLVRSCHDLSEGGLGVAAAEMAVAGRLGLAIRLDAVPTAPASTRAADPDVLLAEGPGRYLLEVEGGRVDDLRRALGADVPHAVVGSVEAEPRLVVSGAAGRPIVDLPVADLVAAWKRTLDPLD